MLITLYAIARFCVTRVDQLKMVEVRITRFRCFHLGSSYTAVTCLP